MMATRVLLLLLAVTAAFAADTCNGTLSVTGQGSETATPDIAKVFLNVQSTQSSAAEARDEAAAATVAVLDAVGAVISAEDEITTLDVSVNPNYSYDDKGNSNITGYTFSQRLQVKVTNLTNDVLSTVIDTAVKTGGNLVVVESIQAELSPPVKKEATDAARVAAVKDAQDTAVLLAEVSGVTLGTVKTITDVQASWPEPIPYARDMVSSAMPAAAPSTPINIGTTDVTATVQMQYSIC